MARFVHLQRETIDSIGHFLAAESFLGWRGVCELALLARCHNVFAHLVDSARRCQFAHCRLLWERPRPIQRRQATNGHDIDGLDQWSDLTERSSYDLETDSDGDNYTGGRSNSSQ